MPEMSAAYENRLRQQREDELRHKRTRVQKCLERMKGYVVGSTLSQQRRQEYPISSSRSCMPPSAQIGYKIDQNEGEMREILDFYGHDATFYYVLATDERLHEA